MFRKMRRIKQQISHEECVQVLKEQLRGVLSVIGDDGYPYGIPINHWYSEEENKLYFHSGPGGHKLDAIAACDQGSSCVTDEGLRKERDWALNIKSVVVFGRMHLVEDDDKKLQICSDITRKFTDDEAYLQEEIKNHFARVVCMELEIEHMTGKLVNEA